MRASPRVAERKLRPKGLFRHASRMIRLRSLPASLHLAQDRACRYGLDLQIRLRFQRRADRDQVVDALGLNTVPGVVEQPGRLAPGLAQPLAEVPDPPVSCPCR